MGSTTSRGYPYPFAADTNNVPADLLALANAINTDVGTVAAAKLDAATVGNLLTTNAATLETDLSGWGSVFQCTVARTTADFYSGAASLLMTATATGNIQAFSDSVANVVPGQLYTSSFQVKVDAAAASATYPLLVGIRWLTAGSVFISDSTIAFGTANKTGWTRALTSAVAPANAARASVVVYFQAVTSGDKFYIDEIGLWKGAGGLWASPGTPIANLGFYTDESVGRRLYQWDANNNRFQMTYGDTGLRDVTAALGNSSHFTINNADLRRVGSTVEFYCDFTTTASYAAGDNLWTVPSGFQPQVSRYGLVYFYASSVAAIYTGGTLPLYSLALSTTYRVHGTWTVTQAWPTTLPGVAIGSIPQ